MKTLYLFIYVAAALLAVACSSGDENEPIILPDDSSDVVASGDDSSTGSDEVDAEGSTTVNVATAVAQTLGFGWNLGNHFDSHYNGEPFPEAWGSWWDAATPTAQLYQNLAAAGVNTVRIPITWGAWQGDAPTYIIDESFMALVQQNVAWAHSAGLNVIINTHHDEFWLDIYNASLSTSTNETIETRIAATWQQVATAFSDEGDYLFFETFNEVHGVDGDTEDWGYGASTTDGGKQYAILNAWNQLAVNTIRATGGNNATRWIMVPGYAASPTITMQTLVLPTDAAEKIMVAVHCYDPYNFTLNSTLDETWGHTSGSSTDESSITTLFAQLKAKYVDQGIPCYLGEMGCSAHTTSRGEACRAYYLEYFCRAAHFAGLAVTLWDNGYDGGGSESHAYIDHNYGAWVGNGETLITTMIKAATSTDESYTLESIYNQAP